MKLKTVRDISLRNKAVLVRVDYNVPIDDYGDRHIILDDTRIRQSLETLGYILAQKPKRVVLMSHLGRPHGIDPEFSLEPVANHLSHLIRKPVRFIYEYPNKDICDHLTGLMNGEIVMIDNVRYYHGELTNLLQYAKDLSRLGDIYVNDAFGSSHRAHASVVGVAQFLPSVAGLLLEKEITMIDRVMDNPKSPLVAVIGGAKAETKIPMIERLMSKADYLLLGGGVGNTFLKAFGYHVGRSLYSKESVDLAQQLIWKATRVETNLYLPEDVVVGSFAEKMKVGVVSNQQIPRQWMSLDIGPKTCATFAEILSKAKTIIWNGPMGANEIPVFSAGTKAVYKAITTNNGALSVVGGGDTLSSIKGKNHLDSITHVSTGGGAMLEYIERGTLPGIEVLQ